MDFEIPTGFQLLEWALLGRYSHIKLMWAAVFSLLVFVIIKFANALV